MANIVPSLLKMSLKVLNIKKEVFFFIINHLSRSKK